MKNLFLALFAILILFCSCSNNTGNTPIIDVKAALGKGVIRNASEFIKDIRYIPLETGPNSMVGNIVKVIVEDNKIYISDNRGVVSIFDMNGRLLNTLNKRGRGPKEYLRITDYTVSPIGSMFILSERDGIVEYDNNLEFVRKISFEPDNAVYYWDITLLKEGLFASNVYDLASFEAGYKQALTIYNDSLEPDISYKTELISDHPASFTMMPYEYYMHNGDLVTYRIVSDTISGIAIDNNYLKSVKYTLDYGGYALTEETMRNVREYTNTNFMSLSALMETNNYLFMTFDFGNLAPEPFYSGESRNIYDRNSYVDGVYDKKSGKLFLLNQPIPGSLGLRDDITGGPVFWPKTVTQDQKLVSWYNPVNLISLAEEGKIDKSLVANLKEDDNQVIVIATPK